MNAIKTLAVFNKWRIGEDERTLDEIGLTPKNIGEAIDGVLKELANLKQQRDELITCLTNVINETDMSYAVETGTYDDVINLLSKIKEQRQRL